MDYVSRNDSKNLLMRHLILVCKYRKNLLTAYGNGVKSIFFDISNEKNFTIIEVEADKNHIHILIQYHPSQSTLGIVGHLMQISTYGIWRQNNNHVYLQRHLWKERRLGRMDILLVA